MFIHINRILLFLFVLISAVSFAQPQNDFRGIVGLGIEKKLSRSFYLNFLNNEIVNQNLTELSLGFADAGITYRMNRNISFSANYRYSKSRTLENIFSKRQMIYADVSVQKYFNKFNFSFRARLQNQFYPHIFSENFKTNQLYYRNRFAVRYKINYYLSPYFSIENFLFLNSYLVFKSL